MVQRLSSINKHFVPNSNFNGGQVGPKRDDDVVIIGMARTAMTRAKKGPQKDTGTEAMLKPVLEDVIKKAGIEKSLVEDIVIGSVL